LAEPKWYQKYAVFITLILIGVAGIIISITLTPFGITLEPYVPQNERVILDDNKNPNLAIVYEDNMLIPVKNYLVEKKSPVNVEVLNPNYKVEKMKLSANASSFLTYESDVSRKNETRGAGLQDNTTSTNPNLFGTVATVRHPLLVQNSSELFNLMVFYTGGNNVTGGNNETTKYAIFPFFWNIKTLDFDNLSYFFIIFLGVTLSRVFTVRPRPVEQSENGGGKSAKLSFKISNAAFLWVPFSAIITLLIFSSFKDKVTLTTDLIMNFALAFGFGFGFDKVFETWHKSVEPDESASHPGNTQAAPSSHERPQERRDAFANK
jgi:hypothetical protein